MAAGVVLGNYIYLMGGRELGEERYHPLSSVEALNLTTGKWKEVREDRENSVDKIVR